MKVHEAPPGMCFMPEDTPEEIEQLMRERDEALEECCKAALLAGLSTGHADNVQDLITEVLWQVEELRQQKARLRKAIEDALARPDYAVSILLAVEVDK